MRIHLHVKRRVIATLLHAKRPDLANVVARLLIARLSQQEAVQLLEIDQKDLGDEEALKKAYRQAALKHHPDRGGDVAQMQLVNEAYELLTKQGSSPGSSPSYPTHTRPKPESRETSFEEAMAAAHVPTTGVSWKFITNTGFGGYRDRSTSGYVVYGKSEREHVFVSVYHYRDIGNAFAPLDIDEYTMRVHKAPIGHELAQLAPRIIRDMWGTFADVKNYNAKVKILPDDCDNFKEMKKYQYNTSIRSIAFKDAMSILGEQVPDQWKSGRLDIVFQIGDHGTGEHDVYLIVLNGKEYKLSDESNAIISRSSRLLQIIFGTYRYEGSKKNLTKMQKPKVIFEYLAKKLEPHEPKNLIEALQAAAAKAKG
jgi:hypothetical protein